MLENSKKILSLSVSLSLASCTRSFTRLDPVRPLTASKGSLRYHTTHCREANGVTRIHYQSKMWNKKKNALIFW